MTKIEAGIAFILAGWLAANILYSIFNRPLGKLTQRFDVFRWLSAYQLFTGTPRHLKLSYLEKSSDNASTGWREIQLLPSPKWYHAIWYPEGLTGEIACSIVDELVVFCESKSGHPAFEKISERFIYKFILRFIEKESAGKNNFAGQFKIEEAGGYTNKENSREIFVSNFHKQ